MIFFSFFLSCILLLLLSIGLLVCCLWFFLTLILMLRDYYYLRSLYNKYVFIDSGNWSCCMLSSNRCRPIFWRMTRLQRSINGRGSAEGKNLILNFYNFSSHWDQSGKCKTKKTEKFANTYGPNLQCISL